MISKPERWARKPITMINLNQWNMTCISRKLQAILEWVLLRGMWTQTTYNTAEFGATAHHPVLLLDMTYTLFLVLTICRAANNSGAPCNKHALKKEESEIYFINVKKRCEQKKSQRAVYIKPKTCEKENSLTLLIINWI